MISFNANREAIEGLSENKKEIALALIDKAEFMETELLKLQKILKEKGWVEEYQNGENQRGLKKSSEADVYNTLLKNYNATVKAIVELVPDGAAFADPVEARFFR